ncbi:MAG: efflux RND transporter periplasmic adaptor subunit [Deltaproteobacteria bacterium]|nr:efflux RND transporter periplasmic adaptor subunit [Deltaproteobacteria bacterium]
MADKERKFGFFRRPFRLIIVPVVIILAVWGYDLIQENEDSDHGLPTFTVKNGPLRISVTATGTVEAKEKIIIKSEVEGTTSIISLVDEGTMVKKGDLLVELDSSKLIDDKVDQEIKVQNAEAAFISSKEDLEVVKNQAESDVDKAELAYEFAVQDLEKYSNGEYPNKLMEAESRITLAREDVARAREKLEWSKKLFAEKYISQTELQADELSEKKATLDLELAQNDLRLLKEYTYKRTMAQLESDVKQAKMTLERTERKARADIVQAEANLKAKESEYRRQVDKLEKIMDQIKKTRIYSPADGQVIHATSSPGGGGPMRRTEPLAEGQNVRERQDLIHLPTSSGFKAKVGVYEASLEKVRKGLPVLVTAGALPGESFVGCVSYIAPMPDATSAFLNPDLKIYDTEIELENNGSTGMLRAGMNCTAEIIVEQYKEAMYVPVQAVMRVAGKPTVYLINGKDVKARQVEIGLDNNIMVRIIRGLEQGEVVSLSPPLAHASVEESGYGKDLELQPPELNIDRTAPDSQTPQRTEIKADTGGSTGTDGRSEDSQQQGNFIVRYDKDNDSRVSKSEFTGPEQIFTRIDRDGDGFITIGEIPDVPPSGARRGQGFPPQQGIESQESLTGGKERQ